MNDKHRNTDSRRVESAPFQRKKISLAVAAGAMMLAAGVSAQQQPMLEEVTVTATRRAQSVQDIPYNITAVTGDTIENSGVGDLNDLVRLIPGLVTADLGADAGGNNSLIMRGLNANNPGTNNILPNVVEPAVSTYLNDTPVFLNLKLIDIERVEVLRGPQGTLYGSGSVGGTVRFIFNKPDTQEASARITAGVGGASHSEDTNYAVDFVGNLPISDNLAVRVAGGYEQIGGVTDADNLSVLDSDGNVVPAGGDAIAGGHTTTSEEDTDESEVQFLRASLLWDVTDSVDALLSVLHQRNEADSDTYLRITDGDNSGDEWENGRRFLTPSEFEANIISLEVEADIGFATFTSSTSYTETEVFATNDISNLYEAIDEGSGGAAYFGSPRLAFLTEADSEFEAITQEFRLVSNGDGAWDWVVGVYYNDNESNLELHDVDHSYEAWLAAVPDGGGTLLDVLNSFSDRTPPFTGAFYQDRTLEFEDKAVFGELTYRFTDQLQVTAGIRAFKQEFESAQVVALPYCGSFCADDGNLNGATAESNRAKFDDQIFKINASYDINDATMVYVTWAEGFRHGGANSFPTTGFAGVDTSFITFEPDEATNYELGLKGTLGESMQYTLAFYQIDWEKIQLDVFAGALGIPGVVNGDEAQSRGVEFELNAQVTEYLSFNFGFGYTDAEITKDAGLLNFTDFVVAEDGDPLPGVPDMQASINVDYLQPLGDSGELRYNVNGSYRSSADTNFNESFGNFTELDAFDKWNASITWSRDKISATAFVNNITDEAGLTGVQNGRAAYSHIGFIGRPRTWGLRLGYDF
ncbi:MAG: TonB-dependent receptor [Pseudomonadales bacterium]